MTSILEAARGIEKTMIEDRRYLHANAETAFDLPITTAYVKKRLLEMNIEPMEICKSGLTATIGQGGKTILIRADMDALPIKENTDVSYKSLNENSHVCGHDMHTAMLLGAAGILKNQEHELEGTIKLMFQPSEEYGQGAKAMVAAGLLENPKVDAAIALHVSAEMNPGKVRYCKGIATSAMDTFLVEIHGKGGHSSAPQLAIDPLLIVNNIYMTLNGLIGKEVDPAETAVLTIGRCGGGTASNIIPDKAVIDMGLRSQNKEVRKHLTERILRIINDVTLMLRGTYTIERISTPAIYNDPILCEQMNKYIAEIVGAGNIEIGAKPLMVTEDFSYISENIPTMFIWAGAGNETNFPLHNPNVKFEENMMPFGAAILANCAINWLKD